MAMFFGTLIVLPIIVAWLPADYFRRDHAHRWPHTLLGWIWLAVRNVLGGLFVLIGISMLVLPGQGLLTILIGVVLMSLPGKRRWMRWLVSRPRIAQAVCWIRARSGQPPLEM
ncbi:MAG: hypothetical protein KDA41_21920 [Planctomycetales bacterium]|nr:hypothetical protein [Planctomycetales bacterium]